MVVVASLALALVASSAAGKGDLTRFSIDERASLGVETISRRPQSRLRAAGTVHVITEEDFSRPW